MDAQTQLGLLATIAATYSGFIAVFLAFVGKDGRFAQDDAHFVQAMVLGTIGVIVMSLTPPVLGLMMPARQVWFVVTVIALLGGVPSMLYQAWQQARIPPEHASRVPMKWHAPGWALGFLALAAFLAALLFEPLRQGFYVAGVSLMLATAIWCFIAVVFRKFF